MDTAALDEFQRIAAESEYPVVILANLDTNDVQLVDLGTLPADAAADTAAAFTARGLACVGICGLVNGQTQTAFDVELDAESIGRITQAVLQHIRKQMRWVMRPDMNVN